MCDINAITNDGHVWTQEDIHQLESKLLLATEEPLCLDPSPAVLLVANRQQFDRKKFNTPGLKRYFTYCKYLINEHLQNLSLKNLNRDVLACSNGS